MRWAAILPLTLLLSCGTTAQDDQSQTTPSGPGSTLNLYSGREEGLVGPIISRYEKQTGIDVKVKYGSTAEMAATLLEEGERSPADMFLAQDAGALGAVAKKGMFLDLPQEILSAVPEKFRSTDSKWVGVTGRARTVVFNTQTLKVTDLPPSILDFTDPKWKNRIGWAPTNGSFQAFVTALRKLKGETTARQWLEGIKANGARIYPSNIPIVQAVGAGEIDVGFVNHYYSIELTKQNPDLKAANFFFQNADPGGLVNVSGAGILRSSKARDNAVELLAYLLSPEAQRYWTQKQYEYPLLESVEPAGGLPPLEQLNPPDIRLSDLDDLEGTLQMLSDVGLT